MNKDNKNTLWIIVGIFLVFLLATQTNFFGAVITSCTNTEPATINDFGLRIAAQNGSVQSISDYSVNGSSFPRYVVTGSEFNGMQLIGMPINMTCQTFLTRVAKAQNNSEYVVLSGKQVLVSNSGNFWCSHNNQFALLATSLQQYSAYQDRFTLCTPIKTTSEIKDSTTCTLINGVWSNTTKVCSCANNATTLGDMGCIATSTNISQVSLLPATESPLSPLDIYISGAAIIIIILGIYWVFEKGPNKGLIQDKKVFRARRRRK